MKDTSKREYDHDTIDHPCAQRTCRHSRDDHGDGTGTTSGCRLCTCSAYFSRSRMLGRRMFWALASSGKRPGGIS